MGFGISEAQSALLATYNTQSQEWDIQGAAEQILAIDVPDQDQPPSRPVSRSSQQRRPQSRSNGEDSLPSSSPSNAASQQQQNMSKEQLVAQASALGNSVFKMANSYWKAGNKAVKQAMDQRAQSATVSNAQRGASPADGRPKWMRDLPPDVQVDDVSLAEAQHSVDTSRHQQQPRHQEEPKEVNLFQDDALPPHPSERKQSSPTPSISPSQPTAPRVYQSSARRRVPQRSAAASPAPSSSKASASPSTPSKPRISYNRPQVSAPAQALTKSSQYRTTGNEHFKLGSYGEAESAYAMAIEALPDNHLAAILAYNNRANARLRNGNERAAIEDCSTVLRLALCLASSEVTAANVDVQVLDEDSTRLEVPGLNLREAVGKALGRRAQAHEAAEKWQAALSDWGLLQQAGASLVQPAGGQRIVSDGIARCRKMLAPAAATQKPAARPAPKRPAPQAAAKPSERLEHVRQDAAKVEAEDAQRLASKDEIDARIMAWKGGKETNLRALIASLDMVIWPELGWKSVGMHELITDNKLKINYMKAIARLHPDKVGLQAFLHFQMRHETDEWRDCS